MNISLNPKFRIFNDHACSYLICTDFYIKNREDRVPVLMLIPPYLGYMLSCFNGDDFVKTVKEISQKLNIGEDKIINFLEKIIENEESYTYSVNKTSIQLPPNLLVKGNLKAEVYNTNSFNPLVKFTPQRPSIPLFLTVMITSKCQTDCIYCYADRSRSDDMGTDQIINIIEEAYNEGVVNVNISGGDIFANKDWRQILKKLTDCNYKPVISTKIPLKEDDIVFLKANKVSEVQLSIDSLDEGTASKLLKTRAGYVERMIQSLDYFEKHEMIVNIKSVLTRYNANVEKMSQLFGILSKYKCIKSWNLTPAFSSAFKADYESYKTGKDQLIEVHNYIQTIKSSIELHVEKIKKMIPDSIKPFDTTALFVKKNKGCAANSYSMGVFSNGKVSLCEMLYYNSFFYIGDLNTHSLKDVWNSTKAHGFYFLDKQKDAQSDSPCYSCDSFKECKGSVIKKFCYADIVNLNTTERWDYPDPRCPKAIGSDLEKALI